MMDDRLVNIKHSAEFTTFENYSKYNLIISIKPRKPRRKLKSVILVPPQSFKIFEHRDTSIDWTTTVFAFEEVI